MEGDVGVLPGSTRQSIEAHNHLDRELYPFVAERFERQVAELGPGLRAELAAFSWLNAELARLGTPLERGDRGRCEDRTATPGAGNLTADPMAMLLEAHASVLMGELDTDALRRKMNAARTRARMLEALTKQRKQKLKVARDRIRQLEGSKLRRLRISCHRARARVAGALLLGGRG